MWSKSTTCLILLIAATLSFGRGNPFDDGLHNHIEEVKFGRNNLLLSPNAKAFPTNTSSFRLPTTSVPKSYDLTLTTNIDRADFEFIGNVKIRIQMKSETDEIVLHYRNNTMNSIKLWEVDGTSQPITITDFNYLPSHDFLLIRLPAVRQVNNEFILEIDYRSELREDGQGFYRGNYTNESGMLTWYAATQFEVDDARHAMPCYDEPGIRAPMTVSIIHGKSFTAISNMEELSREEFDATHYITKFKSMPIMQTYLLAFLISDYKYVQTTVAQSRIPQRIFAVPAAIDNHEGDFAATVVGPILQKMDDYFGVSYPNTKMDHAALTYFNFGAMENYGLITYIDTALLLKPTLTGAARERQENAIISIVAHEFAHQWFGNIVSPQL
jgi:aminopeptidase N